MKDTVLCSTRVKNFMLFAVSKVFITCNHCATHTCWQPEKLKVIEFDNGAQTKITPKYKWGKAKPPVSTQSGFQHFHAVSGGKHTEKSVASLSQKSWLRTVLPQQQQWKRHHFDNSVSSTQQASRLCWQLKAYWLPANEVVWRKMRRIGWLIFTYQIPAEHSGL